jgi:cytochrome c-type biogenesis protein CcmH
VTGRARGWLTWVPWVVLVVVVAVAVAIAAAGRSAPQTLSQRTDAIAAEIRCPSCEDLNAAQSNSQAAVAVRALIRADLANGQTKDQIESYLIGRYGPDIILKPSTHGLTGLVWLIPVLAAGLGLGGAGFALRRWRGQRRAGPAAPDDADRALVEAALTQAGERPE